jgi:Mrp family chromosome partitioning ATPase
MNVMWRRRLERLQRRWWVVVLVTIVALLAAVVSVSQSRPTYVGKSTLVLSGQAPEQDAVMMLGYLTIFRDPATIPRLRAKTTVPDTVTFDASTVASSPILSIQATADDPTTAQIAAREMGVAFSDDINAVQKAGVENEIQDLQNQLDGLPRLDPNGATNPYYASLQERMDSARSSVSSQLLGLQPEAGVTENTPNIGSVLARGALGGLVLGILAALGLAALSTRLTNTDDLRDKTDVVPLIELPRPETRGADSVRRERLRVLANIINLEDLPKPTVIALADVGNASAARGIAVGLARSCAERGERTVLVYGDNAPTQPTGEPGYTEALTDSNRVPDLLVDGDVASLRVLLAGSTGGDRYSLATRERINAVLDELRPDADTIVIVSPSMNDVTDAQLVCAAADATILVIGIGARSGDVTSASATLERHALLLGAVLTDEPRHGLWPRRSPGDHQAPVAAVAAHEPHPSPADRGGPADESRSEVAELHTGAAALPVPEPDHA